MEALKNSSGPEFGVTADSTADETRRMIKRKFVDVFKEHQIPNARQTSLYLAFEAGMSRARAYALATSVSELASNLVFHARRGGRIILVVKWVEDRRCIELECMDDGPGIGNVTLAMTDGYSTNGGLGGGLPGVKRLMDEFRLESSTERGTRVWARKWVESAWPV